MKGRPVDFSTYWNPAVEFDPLAPRGMKLWANVLGEFAGRFLLGAPKRLHHFFYLADASQSAFLL